MSTIHRVQESLAILILEGVLERFPHLMIVSAENEIGWLPHYVQRLDDAERKFGALTGQPLRKRPSEYMRRQVFATFEDDPVGVATHEFFGENNYMWASDFPHVNSTWPNSHRVIGRTFARVPEEVTRKVLFENAAKLYRINLDGR